MAEEVVKEEAKGKGGKKKLFLILILGIVMISLAGGGVFFLLSKKGGEAEEAKKGKKAKGSKHTVFIDMDPIIVNLLDPTGKRYLQIRMSLEVADKKVEEEIKKKDPIIKDIILNTLSGKTVEEVIVPEAKDKIKQELLKKINETLGEELILNLYITQYIVE
ncbi:MAG: flagellar basal body-associated protein FliL [Caldimicrobium sp.]